MTTFKIGSRWIGEDNPVYFIAEIASNHDGSLKRAKTLCKLAKDYGADCAKFQHFQADTIVSDYGFRAVGKTGHHSKWKKSVYDTFKECETPFKWIPELKEYCDSIGIEFMSTPYSFEAVDALEPYVNAYKIGSGDITYGELISYVTSKDRPMILSTGASSFDEVAEAVGHAGGRLCIMQCNTNYSGDLVNRKSMNLNVLKVYAEAFKPCVLGLSDHTVGSGAVLAAVTLGARVIEKHFTDNINRKGPDHPFSTGPKEWEYMVEAVGNLRACLGDGIKRVETNEQETVIVQRRCLRAVRALEAGTVIEDCDLEFLRPAPKDSISPGGLWHVVGRKLKVGVKRGQHIRQNDIL